MTLQLHMMVLQRYKMELQLHMMALQYYLVYVAPAPIFSRLK